jgi:HSP20 family protein
VGIRDIAPFKRRRPTAEDFFSRMHSELDRTFEEFFDRLPLAHREEGYALPAIDMSETEEAIEVKADLPGFAKEDVSLELQNNTLYISGERKTEREEKKKNFHVVERSHGMIKRSVVLPCEVNEEGVDASFSNGVLTIRLPKSEEAVRSKKRIEVKAA